jgi:hypothetical protein
MSMNSEIYGRELVDLRKESRWEFLNTLFSVSEAVMFMQMVDKLDQGLVPAELGPLDYKGLYNVISLATSFTVVHVCCCKILRLFFFRLFPGHFFERM